MTDTGRRSGHCCAAAVAARLDFRDGRATWEAGGKSPLFDRVANTRSNLLRMWAEG